MLRFSDIILWGDRIGFISAVYPKEQCSTGERRLLGDLQTKWWKSGKICLLLGLNNDPPHTSQRHLAIKDIWNSFLNVPFSFFDSDP